MLTREEAAQARLRAGDLVVVKSSGSPSHLGKTALVTDEVERLGACFSNFVQRLRLVGSVEPRFAWYFLNSRFAAQQLDQLGTTTTGLRNITRGILAAVLFPCPPIEKQWAIADYLDRETARIDALTSAKDSTLALL